MPTSTITGTIIDGSGTPVAGVTVYARLRPGPASRLSDGSAVTNPPSTTTNGSGVYSFVLEQQANIVPAGSWWEIEEDATDAAGGRHVRAINVGPSNATVTQSEVTPLALLGPSALTQPQGDSRYQFKGSLPPNAENLCPNSELGLWTALPLRRVGTPIVSSGYANYSAGAGMVTVSSTSAVAGRCGGLTPGKLFLMEGSGTPHAAHVALAATVTVIDALPTRRITAANGSFTGIAVGDVMQLTGGSSTSPLTFYRVTAIDGTNHAYVNVYGGLAAETATFSMTWYQGAYALDSTVNGLPAAGDPTVLSVIGYPLQVTKCNVGSFTATLAGSVGDSAGNTPSTLWEVTPGDDGYGSGDAADGWRKTSTLRAWRAYDYDWDGVTPVTVSGAAYAAKVKKGAVGAEYFYTDLAANAVSSVEANGNRALLRRYRGRQLVFGAWGKAPSGTNLRVFFYDGTNFTYSPYFTNDTFDWQEVAVTVPASAASVQFGWEITGSSANYCFLTQPMAAMGTLLGRGNYVATRGRQGFRVHPNFPQFWVNGTPNGVKLIRLEQESVGALPSGLRGLHIGVELQNSDPTASVYPGLLVTDTPANTIPSITVYNQIVHDQVLFSSDGSGVAASLTRYLGPGRQSAAAGPAEFRVGYDCELVALHCQTGGSTTGTRTYAVTVDGVASGTFTCSSTGTGTQAQVGAPTISPVYINKGQRLAVQLVTDGSASTDTHQCTVTLRPRTNTIVNSGIAMIGRYAEAYPAFPDEWYSDILCVSTGNSGVFNVNIDMFSAEL